MADISELFARDPLSLTHEDTDEIIRYYREKRNQFNLDGATEKAAAVVEVIDHHLGDVDAGQFP